MQYIVIAYDDVDDRAEERRLAAREDHLKLAREMYDSGKWLYAVGILNDDGKMIGSMIVCEFPSKNELKKQWFEKEPYVVGKVWKRIEINRASVAPFCIGK